MKTLAFLFALVFSTYATDEEGPRWNWPTLQDLEKLTLALENKHSSLLEELNGQIAKLEEQLSTLNNQSAKVEEQVDQLEEQSKKLAELRKKNANHQKRIQEQRAEIKKLQVQGPKVAFTASLTREVTAYRGPVHNNTLLIFEHAITNVGNAYNTSTGVFTAPVKGLYHFDIHILGHGGWRTAGVLMKNTEPIVLAHVYYYYGKWQRASTSVCLLLLPKDEVSVMQWPDTRIRDEQGHYTTFNGHLIATI